MPGLIFAKDINDSKRLSGLVQRGKLKRISRGVYSDANVEDIPKLLESSWFEVVKHLCKKPLVAYRTAYELMPVEGHVFVVADVKKRSQLVVAPSLTIELFPGDSEILTEPFTPGLMKSALPRRLLENLMETRSTAKVTKTLGAEWVELQLSKELQKMGEDTLNMIRDQAREQAVVLKLTKEFSKLDRMISALLATKPSSEILKTPIAIASANKQPFDTDRLDLFKGLANYLKQCSFPTVPYLYNSSSWRNLSFFESYFSNYIEGTEFEIEEAEEIIFSNKTIKNRHQDSHDILAVYNIVNDYQEMNETPSTADELLDLIQQRHQLMMAERPEKRPGEFKLKNNKAGNSVFVTPENLVGTLSQSFSYYQMLPEGLSRAIYLQFVIAECHPFDDGNGRLSRIMMNAEFTSVEQHKLIVPTVHRDSYLNGLRQATRQKKFRTLTKVFTQLQAYTASIDWLDYDLAKEKLELDKTFALPDEGIAIFNRQISQFKINLPVG